MTDSELKIKSRDGDDLIKGSSFETNLASHFCSYVWKENESVDSKVVEWDKIQNFDLQPQVLAQFQRQRRGEGFYDIYNAQMVNKAATNYDDLDAMKVLVENEDNGNLRSSLGSKDLETFMQPTFSIIRRSLVDPETDLDYVNEEEKGEEEEEPQTSLTDPSKSKIKSLGKYPDESWLWKIDKHYNGMNWKLAELKDAQQPAKLQYESVFYGFKRPSQLPDIPLSVLDNKDIKAFYHVYSEGIIKKLGTSCSPCKRF